MAFQKAIIGEDGYVGRGVVGATITGDGTGATVVIDANTWMKITAKANSGSIFGNLSVGQFYYTPIDLTGADIPVGDVCVLYSFTKLLDGVSWNVEIAADEIDVTVNANRFKRYRRGKLDANGSASFIYISGITDKADGLAHAFFDICEIADDGQVTYTVADADKFYLVGYLNDGKAKADENQTVATVMEVELFNFTLPSTMGEAGNIDVPFRLVGDADPVLYVITLPVV